VVTHELGHVMGLEHEDSGAHEVMAATLAPSMRNVLPSAPLLSSALAVRHDSAFALGFDPGALAGAYSLATDALHGSSGAEEVPAGDSRAVRARDLFFESLVTEPTPAVLLESRPRSVSDEALALEAIGDYTQFSAELTDQEAGAADELQENPLDEDVLDRLALIH
jgi:hypothetical protein